MAEEGLLDLEGREQEVYSYGVLLNDGRYAQTGECTWSEALAYAHDAVRVCGAYRATITKAGVIVAEFRQEVAA